MPKTSYRWHVALLVVLSASWEALFLRHGLNPLDEGWPLYAAMQMHAGGTLYEDVFFVFPPGHVLSAWLAYALDPPGVVLARLFYSTFNLALCVALYFLGRRLISPTAALLGAAMLAIGAPDSHGAHYLFGYRYLVFSVVALWCFSQRLGTRDARWMFAAGAFAGLALVFRLTPAIAAVAGIGAGALWAGGSWRDVWGDARRFGVGFALVVAPVAGLFSASVGWQTLWAEVIAQPIEMTALQSLPVPPLEGLARWDRWAMRDLWVLLQFRLYSLLFLAYAGYVLLRFSRARRAGRAFDQPLLLAVVVWGGVYFTRAFGRADEAHLDSTLPAVCLLLAHAAGSLFRREWERSEGMRVEGWVVLALCFSGWVWVTNADMYARYPQVRGTHPVEVLDGATAITADTRYRSFDPLVREIRLRTQPGDVLLDLSASSLIHVVSGRAGPGLRDVIMPGTFRTGLEEQRFLERLEAAPPALVVMPRWVFDDDPARALGRSAPRLMRWVSARYSVEEVIGDFALLLPRPPPPKG